MSIYRPFLHITPQKGWINDPNGFSYAFGQFHVFAQHNPYDTKWGPMHWLHFVSEDLVTFKEVGIAIKPDKEYDNVFGCFSGSALEVNQQHYLLYTGAINGVQQQCFAVSSDGIHYQKPYENPLIGQDLLPEPYLVADFRDPYIFVRDQHYYMLVSARKKTGGSSILMYRSIDLIHYEYVGVTLNTDGSDEEMIECPTLFFDGDNVVLMYSLQFKKSHEPHRFQNVHSTIYRLGELDFKSGQFIAKTPEREIDLGFDFYAPQTLTKDNKHYMIAWQNMWDRHYPSLVDGYVGQLTLVRELGIKGNQLVQSFVSSLSNYYEENLLIEKQRQSDILIDIYQTNSYRLIIDMEITDEVVISFVKDNSVMMTLNPTNKTIEFVRPQILNHDQSQATKRVIPFNSVEGRIQLDIVVDNCSLEALIDEGIEAFSMTFFTDSEHEVLIKSDANKPFYINKFEYHSLKGGKHYE